MNSRTVLHMGPVGGFQGDDFLTSGEIRPARTGLGEPVGII